MGPLLFRTVSDGSPKADDGRFVLLLSCLSDGFVNCFVITLTTDELARLIVDHQSLTYLHCQHEELASRRRGTVVQHFQ